MRHGLNEAVAIYCNMSKTASASEREGSRRDISSTPRKGAEMAYGALARGTNEAIGYGAVARVNACSTS